MYRISYNPQVSAVSLARQTLLLYPQVADEENQASGTFSDLPKLTRVVGSGQHSLIFLPLYHSAMNLDPILTHVRNGALAISSIFLLKSL